MKLQHGLQRKKMERLSQKNMQSKIPRNQTQDDYGWLKWLKRCNTFWLVAKKLASPEYVRRQDNALKVMAVRWVINNGVLPPGIKWWNKNWKKGRVMQRNEYKLLSDWEHRMRTTNTARRSDLMLENEPKKMICIVDMACPYELNIHEKRIKKLRKY